MSEITKIPGLKTLITAVSEAAIDMIHEMMIQPKGLDIFVPESELEKHCGKVGNGFILDPAQLQCRAKAFDAALTERFPAGSFERQWNQLIISALSVFEDTSWKQTAKFPPIDFDMIPIPTIDEDHIGKIILAPYYPPEDSHLSSKDVIWL